MLQFFARRTLVVGAALGALVLAGCGDGGGKTDAPGGAKVNPAMPAADPARASKVNGLGPDGQPIDAVQAAEMNEADLPPLPKESYSDVHQPAPLPESAKALQGQKAPAG